MMEYNDGYHEEEGRMKGFKMTINGRTFRVYFQDWNSRVVKCIMKIVHTDGKTLGGTYIGMAKCNAALDEFNLEEGQKIALERAINKFRRNCSALVNRVQDETEKIESMVASGVTNKFCRIWDKAKAKMENAT